MILHHWHWSKCLTMKTAPGPIVTGFCGWKCNVCVTVVYVYTVIIVMQNTGIDNQVQVAWCINDSRSTANRLQLGSQLQAAPSQRGHNSALHPQPSTGPSGQAVLTILHQLRNGPSISMTWLILMVQVWIPMVWSGASVVEVYKSLMDRKTTRLMSIQHGWKNGNLWQQWRRWQCLLKLISSQIPLNADSSWKDIGFH